MTFIRLGFVACVVFVISTVFLSIPGLSELLAARLSVALGLGHCELGDFVFVLWCMPIIYPLSTVPTQSSTQQLELTHKPPEPSACYLVITVAISMSKHYVLIHICLLQCVESTSYVVQNGRGRSNTAPLCTSTVRWATSTNTTLPTTLQIHHGSLPRLICSSSHVFPFSISLARSSLSRSRPAYPYKLYLTG